MVFHNIFFLGGGENCRQRVAIIHLADESDSALMRKLTDDRSDISVCPAAAEDPEQGSAGSAVKHNVFTSCNPPR